MTSGTMHKDGLMAGAARPGTCAVHSAHAGNAAPLYTHKWLGFASQPVSPVITTDRAIPRPLERLP